VAGTYRDRLENATTGTENFASILFPRGVNACAVASTMWILSS